MLTTLRRSLFLLLAPVLAFGQGSQLPKYLVGNLPSAASQPKYTVQVIDGANDQDCITGGGSKNVLCKSTGTAWVPVSPFQSLTTIGTSGPATLNLGVLNVPDYSSLTPVAAFNMVVNPPISGQYAVIYPTSGAITQDPPHRSNIFANGSAAGGHFEWVCEGLLCSIAGQVTANFPVGAFTLPGYINPANVTAIYADVISTSGPTNANWPMSDSYSGTTITCGSQEMMVSVNMYPYSGTEVSKLTTLTGANFNSLASCNLQVGGSGPGSHGQYVDVAALRFLVFYTGTPPPLDTALHLQPPLDLNVATNTLFVNQVNWPAGYVQSVAAAFLPPASSEPGAIVPVYDGLTATDCTTGGGTFNNWCGSNGSVWAIFGSSSSPGITALTGDVTASGSGSVPATIATAAVTYAKMQHISANSKLLGSGASGAGSSPVEITLGTGLSMSGTTLNSSGGSGTPGGSNTQLQYNNSGAFGGDSGSTTDGAGNVTHKTVSTTGVAGAGGAWDATEGTAASAAAGRDVLYADSTSHCFKYSANGGSFACIPTTAGTTVSVNGSSVSTPNFNASTPAAGSNGKNVTWQVSGSSVSAEIVGDGNAAHYLDGTGSYSTPAGGSSSNVVQPVTNATDAAWGVSTSNTATQNQTAFAAIATAVNAGTTSATIFLPQGTYNVLSTGSTALGSYNVPIDFWCENQSNTILNISGSGKVIQLGPSGKVWLTDPVTWTPTTLHGCQLTGGGSASAGIYIANLQLSPTIYDNYFHNFGGASNWQVYSEGTNEVIFHDNVVIRDDGVSGKLAYVSNANCSASSCYPFLSAYDNRVVCTVSTINAGSVACGPGFTTDGYMEAYNNTLSGPVPMFRCGAGFLDGQCHIGSSNLELFGDPAIQFGTVGGSTETVQNVIVNDLQVYSSNAAYHLLGPANSGSKLANSTISLVRLRTGPSQSTMTVPMVSLNNLTGQTGIVSQNNYGWPTLHTTGSNISAWNVTNLIAGAGLSIADNNDGTVTITGGCPSGYQSYDSFVGSSTLAAHVNNCGQSWITYSASTFTGTINVASNTATGTGTGSTEGAYLAQFTPSSADYTVSGNCTPGPAGANCKIYGRANSSANTYYIAIFIGGTGVQLYKSVAGTLTQIGSTYSGVTSGTHLISLGMSGTTITAKVDGTTQITVTDSAISAAGNAGLGLSASSSSVTLFTVQ